MNSHYLPKHDPYRGYSFVVNIVQVLAAIISGFLWSVLSLRFLYVKGLVWVILPVFLLWTGFLSFLILGTALIISAAAKRIINKRTPEDEILISESTPLEWKPVTNEMYEYLREKRKIPWISIVIFIAVLLGLIIVKAPYEVFAVSLTLMAMLCVTLGFYICGDTMKCVSQFADFAVVPVNRTFIKWNVKYAVIYLPEGIYTYRVKNTNVKNLIFLSHGFESRLVCDEEILNMID